MTARRRTCVLRRADIAVTVAAVLAYFPRAFGFVAVPAARCDVRAVRPIRTCVPVAGAAPRVQASARHGKVVLRYSEAPGSGGDKAEDPDAAADAATVAFADSLKEHLAGIWGPTGAEDFSL